MKKLLLIFIVIFVMILTGCSSSTPTAVSTNTSPAPTEAPTATQPKITDTPAATQSNVEEKTTSAPASSEQPDEAMFKKYFSELGLGKIPPGGQLPLGLEKNATVFTSGDQIGLYGNILVECSPRNIIYDPQAQKTVREGGFPKPMKGGFAGGEALDLPAGKYEYKVYVDDTLVAVFPFEVK
ncbi:MAG TPA: hypothetical protein PLQ28_06665 [Flexilinea sp.]|nr:hypothetical protein [Flexilinea sp.]HNY18927.1 hypothetical protein [Flexilinea sp.]HOW07496.1 hypothetical protein [Flexilinea sp.]HPS47605.1 hypothetical protein [Flexilinea sp.]